MHFKIIFIGMEEKIVFNKGIVEDVNDEYKKVYYRLGNDIVETLFFSEDYYGISSFIDRGSVVVINEDDKLTAEELESIKNNDDIILVSGKRNNTIVDFKKKFIFPYLAEQEEVEIYDIILTIYNIFKYEDINERISSIKGIIGFSSKENLQNSILVNVLNDFKIIEKCHEYSLNIYLREELNVAELAYLEDTIKEYTYKSSCFKINQNINEEFKEKIYFTMIGV